MNNKILQQKINRRKSIIDNLPFDKEGCTFNNPSAAHLAHLGLALDDASHRGAEPRLDGLERDAVGVLHGVVEEARDQGLVVHAHVREDARDGDGVDDEGLAGFAPLAVVRGERELRRRANLGARRLLARAEGVVLLGEARRHRRRRDATMRARTGATRARRRRRPRRGEGRRAPGR